jgi:hypothetical protein
MLIDPIELRNWISFVFLIIGGGIAIRSFVISQHQRKLENSFKLIQLCNDSLSHDDLMSWVSINYASSEKAGAQKGFFVDNKVQIPFSELFVPDKIIGQA